MCDLMASLDFLEDIYPGYEIQIFNNKGESMLTPTHPHGFPLTGTYREFENGEFVLHFKPPDTVTTWISGEASPPSEITELVRCTGCFMSKLKSAVSEAYHGRASMIPFEWIRHLDPDRDTNAFSRIGPMVDVLICENSHCGQYQALYYEWQGRGKMFSVLSRSLWTTTPAISNRRKDLMGLVPDGVGIPDIWSIVADYVSPRPGLLPERETGVEIKGDWVDVHTLSDYEPIQFRRQERILDSTHDVGYEFVHSQKGHKSDGFNVVIRLG